MKNLFLIDEEGAHFVPQAISLDRVIRSAPAPYVGRRDSSGPNQGGRQDHHGFNTPIRGQNIYRGQSRG